jgi:hypothetical protein
MIKNEREYKISKGWSRSVKAPSRLSGPVSPKTGMMLNG